VGDALTMSVKFIIDQFVEKIEERFGTRNLRGDECCSVELSLEDGNFFCLDFDAMGTALMMFLFRLPVVKTEMELQIINEALDPQWGDLVGSVVEVRERDLAYFSMVESTSLCAESLMANLIKMISGRKKIIECLAGTIR
jgi:hypothetical protein